MVNLVLPSQTVFRLVTGNESLLLLLLSMILFVGVSVLVGILITKIMKDKQFKISLMGNVFLSGVISTLLYLRYGLSMTAVQGIILFFILLYASCSDITSHTMDDYLWVMVLILGLLSVPTIGLTSMLTGALMVLVPQILIAMLPPHRALGGADIKLSTALAFLLGWQRGLAGLILGLLLAVITVSVVRKIGKRKKKEPFALIPYLSAAAMVMFLI